MATKTAEPVPTRKESEQDWADIEDDEEDVSETVKVDSLDLNKLSISDTSKTSAGESSLHERKLT